MSPKEATRSIEALTERAWELRDEDAEAAGRDAREALEQAGALYAGEGDVAAVAVVRALNTHAYVLEVTAPDRALRAQRACLLLAKIAAAGRSDGDDAVGWLAIALYNLALEEQGVDDEAALRHFEQACDVQRRHCNALADDEQEEEELKDRLAVFLDHARALGRAVDPKWSALAEGLGRRFGEGGGDAAPPTAKTEGKGEGQEDAPTPTRPGAGDTPGAAHPGKTTLRLLGIHEGWSGSVRTGRLTRANGSQADVLVQVFDNIEATPDRLSRVRDHLRARARVSHHAVLRGEHASAIGGKLAVVWEGFEGASAARILRTLRVRNQVLPERAAVEMAATVALALHEVARVLDTSPGVYCRPSLDDVLVDARGVVKLAGLRVGGASGSEPSRSGYGAPEGGNGDATLTYAAAAFLVELLSGESPPESAVDPDRHEAVVRRALIRVLARPRDTPGEPVVQAIRQAMGFDPVGRGSPGAFGRRLRELAVGLQSPGLLAWAPGSIPAILAAVPRPPAGSAGPQGARPPGARPSVLEAARTSSQPTRASGGRTHASPQAEGYIDRGRTYLANGDEARALSDFQLALELAPGTVPPALALGDLHFARKDYGQAIGFYDQVVALDAANAMAVCRRGMCHYFRRDYDRALLDLRRAAVMDPGIPNVERYVEMAEKRLERRV